MIEPMYGILPGLKHYTRSRREKRHSHYPVLFFTTDLPSKLVYSYFAVALAQAGFPVVMPDAPEQGARFDDETRRLQRFWVTAG